MKNGKFVSSVQSVILGIQRSSNLVQASGALTVVFLASAALADEAVTRTTLPSAKHPNGATFTKVTRKGFGEAWRDPSGMIWGDTVKTIQGNSWLATQLDAAKYCKSIGARLPSRKDFFRLWEYMRPTYDGIYTPQVLPNLDKDWFWSSSVHPKYSYLASVFDGKSGITLDDFENGNGYTIAVRCVAPTWRGK